MSRFLSSIFRRVSASIASTSESPIPETVKREAQSLDAALDSDEEGHVARFSGVKGMPCHSPVGTDVTLNPRLRLTSTSHGPLGHSFDLL